MSGTRTGTTRVAVDLDDPHRMLRLNRLARELRLTGQILADDLECVEIIEHHRAPGSTSQDGTRITLDYTAMGTPWTKQAVAVWIGTFAHEIGHSKFTPRATSTLMRRVNAAQSSSMRGIHTVWNICEDARQERLLLGAFGAWRGYLSAMFDKHFNVANPATYPLVVGRTWLPQAVRDGSRALFMSSLVANGFDPADALAVADDIARLIGVYQRLGDPGDMDADVAWVAVEQLYRLLGDPGVPDPPPGCGHQTMTGGWPEDGDEAQDRAESIPVADDDEPEPDEDEGDAEPGDDESESEADDDDPVVATNGDDDEADEADEDDDGEPEGGGSDDEGDDDDDDFGDDGSGEGDDDDEAAPSAADVKDAMREGVRDMLNAPEVAEDLDRIEDALDNGGVGQGSDAPAAKGNWGIAEDKALFLERDVTEALMDLREAAEPGWHRRVGTGRLSIRRFLTDPNWTPDDVFDRFDPGQLDCTALEVVLVADVSGSMSHQCAALGEAVWAIRRAVDQLEGTCHAITFSDGWAVMPGSDERPDGRVFTPIATGGTNPTGALREAARIVMESEAMHKLVIVMTDGSWYIDDKHPLAMEAIHEAGGTTVFVGLGVSKASMEYPTLLGFQYLAEIKQPSDLALLFRDVAYKLMAEAMHA